MNLNIDPADVDLLVKDSIMRSAFGTAVQTAINRNLDKILDDELKIYLKDLVVEILNSTTVKDQITVAVTEMINNKVSKATIDEAADKVITGLLNG